MDSFEQIALGTIQSLRQHPLVASVRAKAYSFATPTTFNMWEKQHMGLVLPHDLRCFYTVTNGLSVTWACKVQDTPIQVGHFSIHPLHDMRKETLPSGDKIIQRAEFPLEKELVAFVLDSTANVGDVLLVYYDAMTAEVWFRDIFGELHFLARSFMDYYRMMLSHLGVVGWQALHVDIELDPAWKPWMKLFIPHHTNHTSTAE